MDIGELNEPIAISTQRWWCYGCRHLKSANDSRESSPCYKCVGRISKPHYDWEMRGLIENNKYCIRCKHFDRDNQVCKKHDDIQQIGYDYRQLPACDDWKFDYMFWNVDSKGIT